MNRKLIVSLICMSFFIVVLSTGGALSENKIKYDEIIPTVRIESFEVIDQQQISSSGLGCPFFSYLWLGQGFSPSLEILTKVEVKLFKNGNPTSPITISIRDSLIGDDLTSASIDSSLVSQYGKWIEFDFPDISATPGNSYYIVCRSSGGSIINYYCAEFDINNPYTGGDAWASIDYGASWGLIEDYYPEYPAPDACFKMYGLDEPPNIPLINGPENGKVGGEYTYTFISTDPESHNLFYYVIWGDGTSSEWIGEYASSETVTLNHIWQNKGTFIIQVKAKDIYGLESDWAEFTVIIPRDKTINNPLLQFFHSHPYLFQLKQKRLPLVGL